MMESCHSETVARDFNPRAPCGARREVLPTDEPDDTISTHAPLAGRDSDPLPGASRRSRFQPTRPLRGATVELPQARYGPWISTHAPLAGRDAAQPALSGQTGYFNPRAPCGARPGKDSIVLGKLCISTHAPLAGRDRPFARRWGYRLIFQPTRPLRGATQEPCAVECRHCGFQPTRPLRGATSRVTVGCRQVEISTHAPLAGRDRPFARRWGYRLIFQPTRPLRGATQEPCAVECRHCGFQPTRPLRGATSRVTVGCRQVEISTHAPLAGRDLWINCSANPEPLISTHAPLAGRDVLWRLVR